MVNKAVTLVGDSIENLANALVMKHAAAMFGADCRFRDTKGLVQPEIDSAAIGETFPTIEVDQIPGLHPRVVAFDNLPGAVEVYNYQAGNNFAVLVGNERRGLSYDCVKLATDKVQVPMLSRRINCLNVAAASAVALYYLCGTRVGRMAVRGEPGNRRPEVLLLGPGTMWKSGAPLVQLPLSDGAVSSLKIASRYGLVATVPSVRKAEQQRAAEEMRSRAFHVPRVLRMPSRVSPLLPLRSRKPRFIE